MFKLRKAATTRPAPAPPFEGHGPDGAERATFAAGCFWGAEAVEVWFDPAQVSYDQLLQTFWRIHNPTTRNRQGFDFGNQYRSAIFYHDAGQYEAAIASHDAEQQSLRRQIVTQITPASAFYRAEEYHQRYLEKHGRTSRAATVR